MFGIDDALIGYGLGALGSVAGGWLSSRSSAQGAREANQNNLQIARETNEMNRRNQVGLLDWQERMSNTAYQRSMADMKAAGLNPILAYSQGGASTPSGASFAAQTGAPMQNEEAATPGAIGQAVSSTINAIRTKFEIDNLRKTNEKISSDTALNRQLAKTSARQAELNVASARQAESSSAQTRQVTQNIATQLPSLKNKEAWDKSLIGRVLSSVNHTMRAINPFGNILSSAKDLAAFVK